MADRALTGVGDPLLGEWREVGDKAVHLRRRLTEREKQRGGLGDPRDIRGLPEEQERLRRLLAEAPYLAPYLAELSA